MFVLAKKHLWNCWTMMMNDSLAQSFSHIFSHLQKNGNFSLKNRSRKWNLFMLYIINALWETRVAKKKSLALVCLLMMSKVNNYWTSWSFSQSSLFKWFLLQNCIKIVGMTSFSSKPCSLISEGRQNPKTFTASKIKYEIHI